MSVEHKVRVDTETRGRDGNNTVVDGRTYSLPDGWTPERVCELLERHGFERIDNRQDWMHGDGP